MRAKSLPGRACVQALYDSPKCRLRACTNADGKRVARSKSLRATSTIRACSGERSVRAAAASSRRPYASSVARA